MKAYCARRNALVQAINTGITKRGFHIIASPEEIPNCRGSKQERLERLHQFAKENGWHVAVHNGNGWMLFTANQIPADHDIRNDLGRLVELVMGGIPAEQWLANPFGRDSAG